MVILTAQTDSNFTFLLLELILADQLADIPPLEPSSGPEWQFHISTVRAHIATSPGRSMPLVEASSSQEWQYEISIVRAHIGRSTGRSTLLDASSGQEWQYEISTVRAHTGISTPPVQESSGQE